MDVLEIDGNVSPEAAARLEQTIWEHMPEGVNPLGSNEFGDYFDSIESRHSDPLALTQLFLTYHLLRQYNDVTEMPFAKPSAALSRLNS